MTKTLHPLLVYKWGEGKGTLIRGERGVFCRYLQGRLIEVGAYPWGRNVFDRPGIRSGILCRSLGFVVFAFGSPFVWLYVRLLGACLAVSLPFIQLLSFGVRSYVSYLNFYLSSEMPVY